MKPYSSFKALLVPDVIGTYLELLSAVREHKESEKKEEIKVFELPEPNFTRVLQSIKNQNGCNVWTDSWTRFDEMVEEVHCRFVCTTPRLGDKEIKRFKGENAI